MQIDNVLRGKRQIHSFKHLTGTLDNRALKDIFEFSNISRPGMRNQRGNCLFGEILAGRFKTEEVFGKGDDVFGPLTQRRYA